MFFKSVNIKKTYFVDVGYQSVRLLIFRLTQPLHKYRN